MDETNGENRLASATADGAGVESYGNNDTGIRVKRVNNSGTTFYPLPHYEVQASGGGSTATTYYSRSRGDTGSAPRRYRRSVFLVNGVAFAIMGLLALFLLFQSTHQHKRGCRVAGLFALSASVLYLLATFGIAPNATALLGHICNLTCLILMPNCARAKA